MELPIERDLAENFAAIRFKCTAQLMDIDAAQLGHQPVRASRREAAKPEIIDARLAPAADDVIALSNFFEEQRDVGGIVLQIAVHGDDVFAAGMVESGGQAGGLAEVAAELDYRNPAINGCD